MKVREMIEKEINCTIEDLRERINYQTRRYNSLIDSPIVVKLDEILVLTTIERELQNYNYTTPTLKLRTDSIEETRELTSKLLQEVEEVKEFKKVFVRFDEKRGIPEWKEVWEGDMLWIEITPCEPSPDCEPVKRVNSYTTWVCETVKKE